MVKSILKVIMSLFLAVLALFAASSIWMGFTGGYFSKLGSDQALMARIPAYEELLAMYNEDRAGGEVSPRDLFDQGRISAERWSHYRTVYETIGLVGEPRIGAGGSVWFTSSVRSLGTAGEMKGLVYRPDKQEPKYDSLDEPPSDLAPDVNALRRINDDWYVFYRYNQ